MLKYSIYLSVFISLAFVSAAMSQTRKEKFGKPPLNDMQMVGYDRDSTAEAVVLFDIGHFRESDITFYRHMRIKILKKSGLDWGNWTFNTPTKGDFKVVVNNLVDGKIVSNKASSDNIYEEDIVDNISVYKVFAPSVQVGSVIDIKYSHVGVPLNWEFQKRIPVLYSELKIEQSKYISYSKSFFGFQPIQTLGYNHWVAKEIPAFVSEPFISTYKNYITKFEFQLKSIGQGMSYYTFSTSWSRVIEILLEHQRFGGILDGTGFLKQIAKGIEEQNISDKKKLVTTVYDSVHKMLNWNGYHGILVSSNFKERFNTTHTANSAEINLSIIYILNYLGIRTFPVVMSTRDNGFLVKQSPSIDKLNHVIAYVKEGDIELFIDGASSYSRPGVLPESSLNQTGLMVTKEAELWVDLNPTKKDQKKQYTIINIDNDGSATANISLQHGDYSYYNWFKEYNKANKNQKVHLENISKSQNDIEILEYQISNNSPEDLKCSEKLTVDLTDQIIDTGDGIIFNPFIMNDYASNPFKASTRKYPVDLMYHYDFSSTTIINIPENFSLRSVPESTKLSLPDGSASFIFLAKANGTNIQFQMKLVLNRTIYTEGEYSELKGFFGEVSRLISQPIEIVKI